MTKQQRTLGIPDDTTLFLPISDALDRYCLMADGGGLYPFAQL